MNTATRTEKLKQWVTLQAHLSTRFENATFNADPSPLQRTQPTALRSKEVLAAWFRHGSTWWYLREQTQCWRLNISSVPPDFSNQLKAGSVFRPGRTVAA
jgi:hypothetical protein